MPNLARNLTDHIEANVYDLARARIDAAGIANHGR